MANRKTCEEQKRKLDDGFVCPKESRTDSLGQVIVNPHYAHPTDCQYFYVCVNGVEPRKLQCEDMNVYDEERKTCDVPSNVPGCEDWFNTE